MQTANLNIYDRDMKIFISSENNFIRIKTIYDILREEEISSKKIGNYILGPKIDRGTIVQPLFNFLVDRESNMYTHIDRSYFYSIRLSVKQFIKMIIYNLKKYNIYDRTFSLIFQNAILKTQKFILEKYKSAICSCCSRDEILIIFEHNDEMLSNINNFFTMINSESFAMFKIYIIEQVSHISSQYDLFDSINYTNFLINIATYNNFYSAFQIVILRSINYYVNNINIALLSTNISYEDKKRILNKNKKDILESLNFIKNNEIFLTLTGFQLYGCFAFNFGRNILNTPVFSFVSTNILYCLQLFLQHNTEFDLFQDNNLSCNFIQYLTDELMSPQKSRFIK